MVHYAFLLVELSKRLLLWRHIHMCVYTWCSRSSIMPYIPPEHVEGFGWQTKTLNQSTWYVRFNRSTKTLTSNTWCAGYSRLIINLNPNTWYVGFGRLIETIVHDLGLTSFGWSTKTIEVNFWVLGMDWSIEIQVFILHYCFCWLTQTYSWKLVQMTLMVHVSHVWILQNLSCGFG